MDERFTLSIDPASINESLRQLRRRISGYWDDGVYTKVRLKLKGQAAAVEIPIAAFVAGELGALALFGPLRAVLTHVSLGSMLEVELIYAPSERVVAARGHIERGELDAAEFALREALDRRPTDAAALFALGELLRDTDRLEEGVQCLERAAASPKHPDGERAAKALARLRAEGWIGPELG